MWQRVGRWFLCFEGADLDGGAWPWCMILEWSGVLEALHGGVWGGAMQLYFKLLKTEGVIELVAREGAVCGGGFLSRWLLVGFGKEPWGIACWTVASHMVAHERSGAVAWAGLDEIESRFRSYGIIKWVMLLIILILIIFSSFNDVSLDNGDYLLYFMWTYHLMTCHEMMKWWW